jgi:hypothetical protein
MYEYQMSVIVEVTIPSEAFEVGQILRVEQPTSVTLETMVPLGGRPTPFVRVKEEVRRSFEQSVRRHPSVSDIEVVNTHDGETLYALNWVPSEGTLFRKILEYPFTPRTISTLSGSLPLTVQYIDADDTGDCQGWSL